MQKTRLKTIVCGSTFGQFYCEAILRLKEQCQLVGILSQGSERSLKCVEKYGIKLYRNVEDLEDDIAIACVVLRSSVMGGKGTELSLKLLNKHINVIQEQPIHYKEIEECVKTAKRNHVTYYVGNLYLNLPAVRDFMAASKLIVNKTNPVYIHASGAAQVSFPLITILSKALPSIKPFNIKRIDRDSGPFHLSTAEISGIPTIFLIHNEVNPMEPDNFMHYLHSITIGTNSGRLCLEDVQGPVRWHYKMHFPLEKDLYTTVEEEWSHELNRICSTEIGEFVSKSYGQVFKVEWINAIAKDIQIATGYINAKTNNQNIYYTRLISNARVWHKFTELLGYAELTEATTFVDINMDEIKKEIKHN